MSSSTTIFTLAFVVAISFSTCMNLFTFVGKHHNFLTFSIGTTLISFLSFFSTSSQLILSAPPCSKVLIRIKIIFIIVWKTIELSTIEFLLAIGHVANAIVGLLAFSSAPMFMIYHSPIHHSPVKSDIRPPYFSFLTSPIGLQLPTRSVIMIYPNFIVKFFDSF